MRTFLLPFLLLPFVALAGPPAAKTSLAITGTSATVTIGAKTVSFYCDTAVYWRPSTSAPEAAVTTDFPLAASAGGEHHIVTVTLDREFHRISVIRQTANGTCYFWSHR